MSMFERIEAKLDTAEAAVLQAKNYQLAEAEKAIQTYKSDFEKCWSNIVKPLFRQFVAEAKAAGYDAKLVEFGTNSSKYGGILYLASDKATTLVTAPADEQATLELSCVPYDQTIVIVQMPDKRKPNVEEPLKLDVRGITKDGLENIFEPFLEAALTTGRQIGVARKAADTTLKIRTTIVSLGSI